MCACVVERKLMNAPFGRVLTVFTTASVKRRLTLWYCVTVTRAG